MDPPTNAGIDFQCTSIAASTPADRTSSVFWTQWKTFTVWTIPLKLYLQACLCFSSAVWNFTASKSSRAPKHAQYTNVVSPSSGPFPLQYACRQWEQTQSLTKGRSKLRLQSCRLKFADLIPWLFRSAWEDKLKVHACVFAKVAFYKMWLKTVWCKNIFLVKWANSFVLMWTKVCQRWPKMFVFQWRGFPSFWFGWGYEIHRGPYFLSEEIDNKLKIILVSHSF